VVVGVVLYLVVVAVLVVIALTTLLLAPFQLPNNLVAAHLLNLLLLLPLELLIP
jgi:hypothetical protein